MLVPVHSPSAPGGAARQARATLARSGGARRDREAGQARRRPRTQSSQQSGPCVCRPFRQAWGSVWCGRFSHVVFPLDFQSPGLALPWLPAPADTSRPHPGTLTPGNRSGARSPRPRRRSPNSGRAPSWTARPTRAPGAWWLSFWGAPAAPWPRQSAPWRGPCWTRCDRPAVGADRTGWRRRGLWEPCLWGWLLAPLPGGASPSYPGGHTACPAQSHRGGPSVSCPVGTLVLSGTWARTDQRHKQPGAGDCRVMRTRSISRPGSILPVWFPDVDRGGPEEEAAFS